MQYCSVIEIITTELRRHYMLGRSESAWCSALRWRHYVWGLVCSSLTKLFITHSSFVSCFALISCATFATIVISYASRSSFVVQIFVITSYICVCVCVCVCSSRIIDYVFVMRHNALIIRLEVIILSEYNHQLYQTSQRLFDKESYATKATKYLCVHNWFGLIRFTFESTR